MSYAPRAYRATPALAARLTLVESPVVAVDFVLLRKVVHAVELLKAGEREAASLLLTHIIDVLDTTDSAHTAPDANTHSPANEVFDPRFI